jgi:hypothetical protein
LGTLIFTALAILAFIVAAVMIVVIRGRQFGALVRRGVPATATVTRKFVTGKSGPGSATRRIGFSYVGPDGKSYERFASIALGQYQALAEGDSLRIVLLPDHPGTSAPEWLVESAREVLNKRKRK